MAIKIKNACERKTLHDSELERHECNSITEKEDGEVKLLDPKTFDSRRMDRQ